MIQKERISFDALLYLKNKEHFVHFLHKFSHLESQGSSNWKSHLVPFHSFSFHINLHNEQGNISLSEDPVLHQTFCRQAQLLQFLHLKLMVDKLYQFQLQFCVLYFSISVIILLKFVYVFSNKLELGQHAQLQIHGYCNKLVYFLL